MNPILVLLKIKDARAAVNALIAELDAGPTTRCGGCGRVRYTDIDAHRFAKELEAIQSKLDKWAGRFEVKKAQAGVRNAG